MLPLRAPVTAFEPFEPLPKTRVEPFGPLKFRGTHELTVYLSERAEAATVVVECYRYVAAPEFTSAT
jgi:hypothetical protein